MPHLAQHAAHSKDIDSVSAATQAILMNKEDTTRVRLVFANQTEDDILLRCSCLSELQPWP